MRSSAPVRQWLTTSLAADRALLALKGPDSLHLLQGLVSNEVLATREKGLVYAGLLKADGRMITDVFTLRHPSTEQELIALDHPASLTTFLRTYFKRHILRSKVKLLPVSESGPELRVAWRVPSENDAAKDAEAERWLQSKASSTGGPDPRAAGMGWRWASPESLLPPQDLFLHADPSAYKLHRLLLGVPEGPEEWPQLPLEGNLDFMNGVEFRKGCYVGQELTARTHHRGVVRKRGVGLRLFREGESVPDEFVAPSTSLKAYPNLFPLPPPGSTLTPLRAPATRSRRGVRPVGKLGGSIPAVTPTGASLAVGWGSVRLDSIPELTDPEGLDDDPMAGVYVVSAPKPTPEELAAQEEKQKSGEITPENVTYESDLEGGRWLAKAFVHDWVREALYEEARRKAEAGDTRDRSFDEDVD